MSILKGLNPGAQVLVTKDFRKGDPATVDATDFVIELELGRKIDMTPIETVVCEVMKRFDEFQKLDSESPS